MTQQTMTKSEILGKVMPDYTGEPTYTISEVLQAMDDFAKQEVAKEREKYEARILETIESMDDIMKGNILIYKKAKQSLTEYEKL